MRSRETARSKVKLETACSQSRPQGAEGGNSQQKRFPPSGSRRAVPAEAYEKFGLIAIQPGIYGPKTSDGKAVKPSPNRLFNAAMPTAPDTVRAGDITFIPTESGWLYPSPHQLFGFRSSWKKTGTPGR